MTENDGLLTKIRGSITNAVKAVKDIQQMHIDYSVKEKTYDLLDKLLDIKNNQLEFFEMLDKAKEKIVKLEQYIESIDKWKNEKESYELFHPIRATTVYRFKSPNNSQNDTHYLCSNCYNSNAKSILQLKIHRMYGTSIMVCHKCNSEYVFQTNLLRDG